MITAVANTATYVEFRLQTFDGVSITGAVIGDFATAPVAKLLPSGVTTATPTITEIGGGWYTAVFSSGLALGEWLYYHVYDTDNDWTDRVHVLTAAQADPAAALAAQTVTISSPLTAAGDLDPIVSGDAYLLADGRAITVDVTGAPSLVGATVTFTAIRAGSVRLTKAMTVVDLNTVRLELTGAETGAWFAGRAYTYEVNALIGASNLLIASGAMTVT